MTTDNTQSIPVIRSTRYELLEKEFNRFNAELTKAYVAYRVSRYNYDKIQTRVEELIVQGSITMDNLDAADSFEESALKALTATRIQMEDCERKYDDLSNITRKLSDALNEARLCFPLQSAAGGDK